MIVTKTPYRISFFGGGTDYPVWYEKFGGDILSTTINHYCYITLKDLSPFFDYKYRVIWRNLDLAKTIDEIKHPVVREVLKKFNITKNLNIHYDGDLPARSGIGSSSAFTCGFIKTIYTLLNTDIDKKQLALEAIDLEQNILKENIGIQDQIATAFGGLNHIKIKKDGDFVVNPISLKNKDFALLQEHMLLFFTGLTREASDIAAEQISQTKKKEHELLKIQEMAIEALKILNQQNIDFDSFGKLLHESWMLKKSLTNKISNNQIDYLYDTAKNNGAIGGKLLGAGGGGFLLIYAKPENHQKIRDSLQLMNVPFTFSDRGAESEILSNYPLY